MRIPPVRPLRTARVHRLRQCSSRVLSVRKGHRRRRRHGRGTRSSPCRRDCNCTRCALASGPLSSSSWGKLGEGHCSAMSSERFRDLYGAQRWPSAGDLGDRCTSNVQLPSICTGGLASPHRRAAHPHIQCVRYDCTAEAPRECWASASSGTAINVGDETAVSEETLKASNHDRGSGPSPASASRLSVALSLSCIARSATPFIRRIILSPLAAVPSVRGAETPPLDGPLGFIAAVEARRLYAHDVVHGMEAYSPVIEH